MRTAIYIIFIFINCSITAQIDVIRINGKVNSSFKNEPVQNAWLSLKLSKGIILESKTDTAGNYAFSFGIEQPMSYTLTIASDKNTVSKTAKQGFIASKETLEGKLYGDTIINKEFTLKKVYNCGLEIPAILFYQNSVISCNDSLFKTDSLQYKPFQYAINSMLEFLTNEPESIIQLNGCTSSREKKKQILSELRAQKIKELLVSKGIDPGRILTCGNKTEPGRATQEMLQEAANAKTITQKNTLHLKNQRVAFRILSWDYTDRN